jgi:hypothetical protein
VIRVDRLLQKRRHLCLASEPPHPRPGAATRLIRGHVGGSRHAVHAASYAVAVGVGFVFIRADHGVGDRFDQPRAEDRRWQAARYVDAGRERFRKCAWNEAVLNLRAPFAGHQIAAAAETNQDIAGASAPVAAVTRAARHIVEDRSQSFTDRKIAMELHVTVLEITELAVVEPVSGWSKRDPFGLFGEMLPYRRRHQPQIANTGGAGVSRCVSF